MLFFAVIYSGSFPSIFHIKDLGHFSTTTSNYTSTPFIAFLLTGVPGLEDFQIWISIPFNFMYFLAVTDNGLVMVMVICDRSLHEPMYLFLAMLALNVVLLCTITVPKMLLIFWQGPSISTFSACLTQMFSFMLCFSLNLLSYWPWLLTAMWLSMHHSIILPYLQALSLAKWSWLWWLEVVWLWSPLVSYSFSACTSARATSFTILTVRTWALPNWLAIALSLIAFMGSLLLSSPQDWTLSLSSCPTG